MTSLNMTATIMELLELEFEPQQPEHGACPAVCCICPGLIPIPLHEQPSSGTLMAPSLTHLGVCSVSFLRGFS